MDTITGFEVFSLISPILAVCVSLLGMRRNMKESDTKAAREMATLIGDMGYIKAQLEDLKKQYQDSEHRYLENVQRHHEVIERVIACEQATKSAHKRIDLIEPQVVGGSTRATRSNRDGIDTE